LPSWSLRAAFVAALGARAVFVWRGFAAQVKKEEEEEREGRGGGGKVGSAREEWQEDARCVWRVLRGEEEREILRACRGGEGVGAVVVRG
jgi:hypothetical protein